MKTLKGEGLRPGINSICYGWAYNQSEVRKRKTNIVYERTSVESRKMVQMNLLAEQKQRHSIENKHMDSKGRKGRDELRDWDGQRYAPVYKTDD